MPTTIYTNSNVTNLTAGQAGATWRNELAITGGAQGQVRVTFQNVAGSTFDVAHASIGISKLDSTASTTATPVELLFSGVSGFSLSASASIVSDWVNLSGFTGSDKLIVDMGVSGSGSGGIPYATAGVLGTYSKASVDDYNVATVAGYSFNGSAEVGVSLIEVQSSGDTFANNGQINFI